MGKSIIGSDDIKYYIAYDLNKKVFHVNNINDGENCTTGLPNIETFSTKKDVENRIKSLSGDKYFLKKNNITLK